MNKKSTKGWGNGGGSVWSKLMGERRLKGNRCFDEVNAEAVRF